MYLIEEEHTTLSEVLDAARCANDYIDTSPQRIAGGAHRAAAIHADAAEIARHRLDLRAYLLR